MYVCIDVCIDVCMYVCMYVCTYICIKLCMHADKYVCIRMYGKYECMLLSMMPVLYKPVSS